jgi:hypothetical protein
LPTLSGTWHCPATCRKAVGCANERSLAEDARSMGEALSSQTDLSIAGGQMNGDLL